MSDPAVNAEREMWMTVRDASSGLREQVALVTGASSGIGEATALALASAGATVAVAARRRDRLDALVARIASAGGDAIAVTADLADRDGVERLVAEVEDRCGGVDVLVNNAGVMLLGFVERADPDEWRRMIDVNVLGLLHCTRAVLPGMRARDRGHIVNLSSVAGRVTAPGNAVYNLTKFGVVAFSDALRQELAPTAIRVTVMEPGYVDTDLQVDVTRDPEVLRQRAGFDAMGPPLRPYDVADAILYAVTRPQHVSVNEMLIRPSGHVR
jgi:NADP-dependent 3-hydroxy acid dehydrogenase YdfG